MMKRVKDALKNEKLTQKQLQDLILQMAERLEDLEGRVKEAEERGSTLDTEDGSPRITLI